MSALAIRTQDVVAPGKLQWIPGLIVFGAVSFNAVLAFVNGNVTGLTPAPVVAAEVFFVASAHAVALKNFRPEMAAWYALLGLFLVFAIIRCVAYETFDVKYLRDVMIIPTFVVLGMTFDARRLVPLLIAVQTTMLVFLLLEAIDTQLYADIFKIQDYYINTRGFNAEDFWNKDSTLFVSATRPDDRFFALMDLHRLSSIFLEPVSLGNYCMVIVAYLCACFDEIGSKARWFFIISTAMAIVGCDGRLAMVSTIVMVVCCYFAPRLPRNSALLYAPGVLALAIILVTIGHFEPGGDDFPGRIAHTVYLLSDYGMPEFLGVSEKYLAKAVDSGIAYLITTQSIFVVVALWAVIVATASEDSPDKIRYTHAVCIFVALNMMISSSLLTIKTSAIMWLLFGSLQLRRSSHQQARGGSSMKVADIIRRNLSTSKHI